jgi:type VI secretion system protein ImpK
MAGFDLSFASPPRETPARYGGLMRELLGFHLLLLREREDAEAEARAEARQPAADVAPAAMSATRLLDRLEETLRLRWENARRTLSDREMANLRATQYLMCALADDLFLHEVEWRGREAWSAEVLEQRVFATRVAGERVFETAADLARRRDPAESDLLAVHLAVIGLGFKGRYRGPDHAARLDAHARELFEVLSGRAAGPSFGAHDLVPGAITNVVTGQRVRRRWRVTLGIGALLAIAATFLVLSTLIWFALTGDLAAAANAVLRAAA